MTHKARGEYLGLSANGYFRESPLSAASFNGEKFAMNATPKCASERVDGLEWRRGRLRISGNAILQFLHPFDE